MGDAVAACGHFAHLAEEEERRQGKLVNNGTEDFVTRIFHEPIGVVGMITPWNYPFLMGMWKVVAGIAAGCSMVLKPSELAPLSCILLGEMAFEAGLPAGALNVIPGLGATAGGALASHPGVDKISFTGSVPTAQKIMAAAALGPRGLSLELGGKSPLVVFPDADVSGAVDWIITGEATCLVVTARVAAKHFSLYAHCDVIGILWGSGQVCSATSRVLLHESIRERVLTALLEKVRALRIVDTSTEESRAFEGPQLGPVISKGQYDKIWVSPDPCLVRIMCSLSALVNVIL
jgi:betaine-aldehyde dehydrogenase